MDANMKWFHQTRCQAVVKALQHNRFAAYYAADKDEARKQVLALIPDNASVAFGGSRSMFETDLVESLRNGPYDLIDRHAPGLSPEELKDIALRSLHVDFFLASANAITEDGQMLFVDGANTRVGPLLLGPKNVVLVIGANKICTDLIAADKRTRTVARPVNAKRLNTKTPCLADGICHDCHSPARICNTTVILHRPSMWGDLHKTHVIMVAEDLGY